MRKRIFALLLALALLPLHALAVPAYSGPISFTEETTGETVQVYQHGDERFSFLTDASNRLLVKDAEGRLRYVVEQGKALALGGYVTDHAPDADALDAAVSAGTPLRYESAPDDLKEQLQSLRDSVSLSAARSAGKAVVPKPADWLGNIPTDYDYNADDSDDAGKDHIQLCTYEEGKKFTDVNLYPAREATIPLLVLKVNFNDVTCYFSDQQWKDRIFGGVGRYYSTVSNNTFTYVPVEEGSGSVNDGVVSVKLDFNCPPYVLEGTDNQNYGKGPLAGLYKDTGKTYAIYNMASIFAYAILAAEDQMDFSQYDRNADGVLSPTELAVLMIYPAYEASLISDAIAEGRPAGWAHSWFYNNYLTVMPDVGYRYLTMSVDGMRVIKYTFISELNCFPNQYDIYTRAGTPVQAQFGTASHELGHDLGLPDLYNTSSSYLKMDVGDLSLMAGGSWGCITGEQWGSSPTHLDAYCKIHLGFYTAQVAAPDNSYILYASEPSSNFNILRLNTADPDVYYLLENREYVGFDRGLEDMNLAYAPGGVVVWRVNEAVMQRYWDDNSVNNHEGNYGLMPMFTIPDDCMSNPFWSRATDSALLKALEKKLGMTIGSEPGEAMTLNMTEPTTAKSAPNTGDHEPVWIWLTLAVLAVGAAAFLLIRWKGKEGKGFRRSR